VDIDELYFVNKAQQTFTVEDSIAKRNGVKPDNSPYPSRRTYTDAEGNTLYVLAGNYDVYLRKDSQVKGPYQFSISANNVMNAKENVFEIHDSMLGGTTPIVIDYQVTQNGVKDTETTTELTFIFDEDLGAGLAASNITIASGTTTKSGTLTQLSGTKYVLPVTVSQQELIAVKVDFANVTTSLKPVWVWKNEPPQTTFIPIEEIRLSSYTLPSSTYTIVTYEIIPNNATNKAPLYFFRGAFAGLDKGQDVSSITWSQPGTTLNGGTTDPWKGELKVRIDWSVWASYKEPVKVLGIQIGTIYNKDKTHMSIMAYVPKGLSEDGTSSIGRGIATADEAVMMKVGRNKPLTNPMTDAYYASFSAMNTAMTGVTWSEEGVPFSDPRIKFTKQ
jgi:hypothetical protein